ncbi:MAG: pseudomurein-binding repeat-containing protein [Methanobacteriaceae archaeon]|nr:pseudomurein-binding repeat-containing protein [Methanobacteriaceae archaeon]
MALSGTENRSDKICPKCGNLNDEDASFCENCGIHIKRTSLLSKDYLPPEKAESGLNGKIIIILLIFVVIVGALTGVLLKNNIENNQSQEGLQESNTTIIKEETLQNLGFPITDIPNLANAILNSNYPDKIQYKGYSLSKAQYLYILARGVVAIDQGETGNITIKSFSPAEAPYGTVASAEIARSNYVDMARRVSNWMDANGRAPNYAGIITPGADDLSTDMTITTFVKALDYYYATGELPSIVSVP